MKHTSAAPTPGRDRAAVREGERVLTWEHWLAKRSPLGGVATGFLLSLLVFGLYVAAAWAEGSLGAGVAEEGPPQDAWYALILSLVFWVMMSVPPYVWRANLAEARRLAPFVPGLAPQVLDGLENGITRKQWRRSSWFWLAGAAVGLSFYLFQHNRAAPGIDLAGFGLVSAWFAVISAILVGQLVRGLSHLRHEATSISGHLGEGLEIDILELDKLKGFGRIAFRDTVIWLLAGALLLLLFVGRGFDAYLLPFLMVIVVSAIGIFFLALQPVHAAIREKKALDLERVRSEIVSARDGAAAGESPGRLADLLAYEKRIGEISAWPLDQPTLLRFVLFLAIPLGSWLGGALVERLVDLTLD